MADADGYFDGSNVDLMIELSDAREAQRSYEANLKVFEQTRKMSSGLMELLRK
jgi:flagellar basal-body rod protein FlgC